MSGGVWTGAGFDRALDPEDRGPLLGDGIFDTLVAFRGTPFAGDPHLDRLVAQAASIGITLERSRVRDAWKHALAAAPHDAVILRTTVTRGRAARGLWPVETARPTLLLAISRWQSGMLGRPVRLMTSAIRRNPTAPSASLKTLGYLDNILAVRDAQSAGADDALFLTPDDRVACTSIANIFAVVDGVLRTPPVHDGVMPGIMRGLVITAASELGLPCAEASLSPEDLRRAESVFLTNSVRFLGPVIALDGLALPDAAIRGELATRICAEVARQCGTDPRSS